MNPKVQIVATTPVLYAIRNGGKCGRGERIRTSGPCLPKAVTLAAHGDFPSHRRRKPAHLLWSSAVPNRAEVQGTTFDPCLRNGPASDGYRVQGLISECMEVHP